MTFSVVPLLSSLLLLCLVLIRIGLGYSTPLRPVCLIKEGIVLKNGRCFVSPRKAFCSVFSISPRRICSCHWILNLVSIFFLRLSSMISPVDSPMQLNEGLEFLRWSFQGDSLPALILDSFEKKLAFSLLPTHFKIMSLTEPAERFRTYKRGRSPCPKVSASSVLCTSACNRTHCRVSLVLLSSLRRHFHTNFGWQSSEAQFHNNNNWFYFYKGHREPSPMLLA